MLANYSMDSQRKETCELNLRGKDEVSGSIPDRGSSRLIRHLHNMRVFFVEVKKPTRAETQPRGVESGQGSLRGAGGVSRLRGRGDARRAWSTGGYEPLGHSPQGSPRCTLPRGAASPPLAGLGRR